MKSKSSVRRRSFLRLEQLETRDAPATGVSATKLTYQDIDGDNVTVTFSKPILTAVNVNSVFKFDTGTVDGKNDTKQQLQTINLTGFGLGADGTSINVTATHGAKTASDGLVNVGYINATGIDLGPVTVAGDLGQIDAGDSDPTAPALKSLNVRSMGRLGLDTQAVAGDLRSDIAGALGSLTVKGDIVGARINADNAADGKIGSVFIGGSLTGGTPSSSGTVIASGDVGAVRIGRDLVGGTGIGSGGIFVGGKLASVSIGGSVIGGPGGGTGIRAIGDIGVVNIAHNLQGGSTNAATNSGSIVSEGKIAAVTIGGSIIGGFGSGSGVVFTYGALGAVRVAHDLLGGPGDFSGRIFSGGKLSSVTIGGSVVGGSHIETGIIDSDGDMGPVSIGRDLQGGTDGVSGMIRSEGKLASLRIGGSIVGGSDLQTGYVVSGGDMGAVRIGGDVRGGSGINSGRIESKGNLTSVNIGGSIIGGSNLNAGSIASASLSGKMGAVAIGHDVMGGSGSFSGAVVTSSALASISIAGSLIGGSSNNSGVILTTGDIGPVRISHDLIGGSIDGTAGTLDRTGYIGSNLGRIASVSIGGSIVSGVDTSSGGGLTRNATIRAGDDIGSLMVSGSMIGNSNPEGDSPVIISARGRHTVPAGATSDLAIGRISVGGRVEYAQILAGYEPNLLAAKNADAQIGPVNVAKDWIASDLVAGVVDGGNGFGNTGDAKITGGTDSGTIVSKIASITIGGIAIGTPSSVDAGDHYGFVAQQIGSLRVNGFNFPLTGGAANDLFPGIVVGVTNDLNVLEVTL